MEKRLICGNKYQVKNETIALPVVLEGLPNEIVIEGTSLVLKSPFHVSLVCIWKIIEKYGVVIPDFESAIINDFCSFVETNDVQLLHFRDDFRFVTQNDLKSVIVMCEVSNLEKFFELINRKYSLQMESPPTHVTLYTLPSKSGIFVTDASDVEKLTRKIENPIGRSL